MKKLFIFLLCCFITASSFSQQTIDKEKVTIFSKCDNLLKMFSQGKFSQAILTLKDFSAIEKATIDSLAITTEEQMLGVTYTYGKINSYEYINSKTIKDFLIKRMYILRFEHYYLKFCFTLYKTGTSWAVTNFIYNEDIDELFK